MYRMVWPAQALADQGADVQLVMPDAPADEQLHCWWWGDDEADVFDVDAPDADVIVLQRPLQAHLVRAILKLQAKGVRVVVEIDDDFEAIHPQNVSWATCHPSRSPDRNWSHLRHACQLADLVTVTTPALAARYGAHGRVAVVPNCVPERLLGVHRDPHDGLWMGWSGSVATHPTDLQAAGGGIARAIRSTGAHFAVIGTGQGVQRALGLPEPPRASGWRPIDEYHEALGQLDVGVVPLALTAFNEAKSWLKGLEMAAVGVPFVASSTGPYRQLEALGAGTVAGKPRRWEAELKGLLSSAVYRGEMADQGREAARRLTIEGNCGRWWDAWASVVNARSAA